MDPGEIGFGGIECIGLVLDRDQRRYLVNAAINLRVT
jgi:hypothetical protein